ncbi:MAG: RCC1 domain-containing protein [Sandaracinaceae bacterium]
MTRSSMWFAVLSVLSLGCGGSPAPAADESVTLTVRVRDDLDPRVEAGGAGLPSCDLPGPDGLMVIDLDGGYAHACAVLSDGRVRCWGQSFAGQLGDGSYAERSAPVPARDVTGAVRVGAGRAHTCALLRDGGVMCWGGNDHGQLGAARRGRDVGIGPVHVAGLRGATGLAVGDDHACAIDARGNVLCWGRNNLGQIGDGSREPRDTPVRIAGVRASYLGAGADSTCAVLTDGRVACWGGVGGSERPSLVAGLPAPAVTVEVGDASACARLADGSVFCWGDGSHGQLGPAGEGMSLSPIRIEGLPPAMTLAHAGTRACITDPAGSLFCWGARDATAAEASAIREIGGLAPARSAGITARAYCASLSNGGVCCWGSNVDGILGSAVRPFGAPAESSELPVPMTW